MKHKLALVFTPLIFISLMLLGLIYFRLYSPVDFHKIGTTPPTHELWGALLKDFVQNGHVNYIRLHENSEQLNIYLSRLKEHSPSSDWSKEESLAYWINAYNAFTLKIILDNYPVESIKDIGSNIQIPLINSTWDIPFIEIGDKELTLNDIEHRILRKDFNEPTIHFAIVCASVSCPSLRSEAYTAGKIYKQLNEQALAFINDKSKNQIATNQVKISKIFSWFEGDFTKEGNLIDFLNQYSKVKINKEADISYMDYNWSLNN